MPIVRINPDGAMKLAAFGDGGHIPGNPRTFSGGGDPAKEFID